MIKVQMENTPPFDKNRAFSWYPGHMLKAQRRMAGELGQIDIVIELRDARLPILSGNPELSRLIGQRKRLLIFNKASLSDPATNKRWIRYYASRDVPVLFMDADSRSGLNLILPLLRALTLEIEEKFRNRGIRPPPHRLMVVGMPNVGKSTFINRMLRKNRLKTAPLPGTTRGLNWIELKRNYLLMDTPGVMLPRIEKEHDAFKLAWIGSLPDRLMGADNTAAALLEELGRSDPNHATLRSFYRMPGPADDPYPALFLEEFCSHRGFKSTGNTLDRNRGSETLLQDFRGGKLGRYSFETPE